jgi:hypothetical protein
MVRNTENCRKGSHGGAAYGFDVPQQALFAGKVTHTTL